MPQIRWAAYLLSALLGIALLTSMLWKPKPPSRFHRIDASLIPNRVGDYVGTDIALDKDTLAALSSAQVIDREYRSPNGGVVSFALIGGADRDALHDPRSCIVGAGGRIDNDRVVSLPGVGGIKVRECDAVFAGSDGHDTGTIGDTIFFYVTPDGIVSDATQIRAKLLLSAFEQRGEPVFFYRCLVPYNADASPEMRAIAHKRLMDFTAEMWKKSSSVVLEGLK